MSKAASPTAVMVMEAIRNGMVPPINMPTSTTGSDISSEKSAVVRFDGFDEGGDNRQCSQCRRTDSKPLADGRSRVTHLVQPSVILRVSSPMPAISAMPPALSATGP